ncbi:adenosine kinase [Teredinibacter turnerae]|uniref:adenosine kinase n=1 Tax=Teredinibacter turnerae TaxID=2426 RepID=UPI0030D5AED8
MTQIDIYGLGAALLDTEVEVSDGDLSALNVEKGVMTLVDEPRQHELMASLKGHLVASKRASGGSAANSIIAASYFGSRTFYSCRVANDENGEFYLADLASAGVQYHSSNGSNDGITGKCLVMITPDAERTMHTFLGISEQLCFDDVDENALKQSKYVYIEGYQVTSESGRPTAIKLRQQAEALGVKTALTLSDPAIVKFFHDGMREMVGDGVDILFCNEQEAQSFTQCDDLEGAFEALKTHAKTFAITRGSEGALIFDGEERIAVSAPEVKAIDTNGAGDMFAGAFLHALSQGKNYRTAGEFGCKAAAQIVTQFGPRLQPEQYKALVASL